MTMEKAALIPAFICLISGALVGVFYAERLSRLFFDNWRLRISPSLVALSVLLCSFFGLVAFGVSGSSMKTTIDNSTFIRHDLVSLIGKSRGIRGDEASVNTPMAIGQYNHTPRFPVVNTHIGPEGQNMLVIGLSGMPVSHFSALSKPATWGFFFLDLRQALSWYWWFPVFGCLLSLWGVLNLVFPGRWRLMLALSAAFTFSPYAVAWSFWPAYAVFFPSVSLLIVLFSLKQRSLLRLLPLSVLLGLSLAGFVLVLYPPWQVTLGYLFLFFFVGVVIRDRLYAGVTLWHGLMIAIAVVTAGLILYSWWHDARFAVNAMLQTVYPGQRLMVPGGDVEPFSLVKGVSNIITLHKSFHYSNASEMASFVYVIIPLLLSVAAALFSARRADPLAICLMLFVMTVFIYQYVGIPAALAKLSLWGRSTTTRADLALGLAQICLIAFSLTGREGSVHERFPFLSNRLFQYAMPVLWSGFLLFLFWRLTLRFEPIHGNMFLMVWIVVTIYIALTGLSSWYLLTGRSRSFVIVYCFLTFSISLPFNPLIRAPGIFALKPGFQPVNDGGGRVLVMDNSASQAMMLMAAGQPVLNGVHYYPQAILWHRLDPSGSKETVYNRYQHLCFDDGRFPDASAFRIENPNIDVVRVIVDGSGFDFRSLPADAVVVPDPTASALARNSTLSLGSSNYGWRTYRVRR
ncbi:MAG TPA: hypothetical protein VN367_10080 [Chlorobaculum sp.]|nr:hypothetical protein [Chlorobaculum sp.]